ncbi:MAG: protein tyrosine phosphatase family protein [Anaerolineae bacterium]|jgi:protein tyrosine phosphatase (PTP) superfamily phosphohydrolase (DUF442 family)
MEMVLDDIVNYLEISELLGTGGQPTAEQFSDIQTAGYEVVVNLAMPDSTNALPNEAELVREQGMEYVHIPVVWEDPGDDDLDRFFRTMAQARGRKVFVHCVVNWRVSCFVYLYRVVELGIAMKRAEQSLLRIWKPEPVWQGFLERSLARYEVAG